MDTTCNSERFPYMHLWQKNRKLPKGFKIELRSNCTLTA